MIFEDTDTSKMWLIEPEKAKQMAERREAFEARKFPLLASGGLLDRVDPEKIVADRQEHQNAWDKMQKRFRRKARLLRYLALKTATTEQAATLDARRAALPCDPVYACTFWRSRIKERLAGENWLSYDFSVEGSPSRNVRTA